MAQVIDVPGYGPTEFPDGMSDDDIVSAIKKNASPQQSKNPSWKDFLQPIAAPLEVGAQMGSSLVGQVLGGWSGILSGGDAESVKSVQDAFTYEPKTELGQGLSKAIAYPFQKANEAMKSVGGSIGEKVGGEDGRLVGESIGEVAIPVAGTLAGGGAMLKGARSSAAAAKQAAIDKSVQDAARIDAAKLAVEKYGLSIDPVVSNPGKLNSTLVTAAGYDKTNALMRRINEPKVISILKDDVGIPKEIPLTSSAPFDAVREVAGAAKREIQTMKSFVDDGSAATQIADLSPKSTIGMGAVKTRINKLITDANALLAKNPSGAELIAEIETLRKAARRAYKSKEATQPMIDIADSQMGIANSLEAMIERNLSTVGRNDLLQSFRDGRTKMAKSYALQDATNMNTGLVDPSIIAKMTAKDNSLTGAFADIGRIAGNFPESLGVKAGAAGGLKELGATHLTRTGAGGFVGYGVGSLFGQPLLGAAIGAAGGELAGGMLGSRIAGSPAWQRALSVPKDFRPVLGGQTMIGATNTGMLTGQKP